MSLPTIIECFERAVRRDPAALAVKDARSSCSYGELQARAAVLAASLCDRGLRHGDTVVVFCDRGVHALVAILAVLDIGGVFVPISLDTPPGRVSFMLDDVRPGLLLIDEAGRRRLPHGTERYDRLLLEDAVPPVAAAAPAGPPVARALDDLAYVVYTSGTTGEPKGVMVDHRSLAHRFSDWERVFRLSEHPCRCLQLAKLGFDVFIGDFVKALCSGGTLVICPGEAVVDPARLYRWLVDEAIDYVEVVPAIVRPLVEFLEASGHDLSTLGVLNCGADSWTRDEYERCRRVTRAVRVLNSYGVTECTVESTVYEDEGGAEQAPLPIGRPLPSDHLIVIDDQGRLVAPGVTGEICIGGPCVARGYLGRPELDRRVFFEAPGLDGRTRRFYRTGDRGRMDSRGLFEFLGRTDTQVKINGHRVELEEIERVLERLPEVRQAVVLFDAARRTLTAAVRTRDGRAPDSAAMATQLARQLPTHMIPTRMVTVDTIPLTQNHKIDRVRLASLLAIADQPSARRRGLLDDVRTPAELSAALDRLGIDLLSLVNEFVRPSARIAIIAQRPCDTDDPIAVAGLSLLVLLEDGRAMKRTKQQLSGSSIEHLPAPPGHTRLIVAVAGLDITLAFVPGDAAMPAGDGVRDPLGSGWVLHGAEIVERLRRDQGASAPA